MSIENYRIALDVAVDTSVIDTSSYPGDWKWAHALGQGIVTRLASVKPVTTPFLKGSLDHLLDEPAEPGARSNDPLDDGYTDKPTAVRLYWEDHGDEFPWCIDGIDFQGRYTEDVSRYATAGEALTHASTMIAGLAPEKDWHPATMHQIRMWLDGGWGVGSGLGHGKGHVTAVRETEHGLEYQA